MVSCAELGEDGVLRRILPLLGRRGPVVIGPGDDAAVLSLSGDLVATTDMLIEDEDFRLEWAGATDVGHKAAAQNLADVEAMGATPVALLVSLAFPPETDVEWPEGLARALDAECALTGVSVVGGDLSGSRRIIVSVTAFGQLEGRPAVRRDGARPGDLVALAGTVGRSAAGLDLLLDGRFAPVAGASSVADRRLETFIATQLRPRPPYGAGVAAARAGATSMCDVSDGLIRDAGRLARASGTVFDLTGDFAVERAELRLAAAALAGGDPEAVQARLDGWILAGGEDHSLLATFPPEVEPPPSFRQIGVVRAGDPGVARNGRPVASRGGWDHFASRS